MAGFYVTVGWFNRITTKHMYAVERLSETNEILVIMRIALATTTVKILCIGGGANGRKHHAIATDFHAVRRVSSVKREFFRC